MGKKNFIPVFRLKIKTSSYYTYIKFQVLLQIKESFQPCDLHKMIVEENLKPTATFYATQKSRKYINS